MSNNRKDPIIIYYAFHENVRSEHEAILLDLSPKSLMSHIVKTRSIENNMLHSYPRQDIRTPGYHVCSALHEIADTTYIINSPFDIDVKFDENNIIDRSSAKSGFCLIDRFGSFIDSVSADFVYEFLMFSEEEIEVSFTPPYMHNTSLSKYGFISAAKMNIGKWFRPIPIIFHSWPGIKELKINSGEPLMYITINGSGNRKIIFKEFVETQEIKKIVYSLGTHKDLGGYKTLDTLYEIFGKTTMKNRILKEIKDNIVS